MYSNLLGQGIKVKWGSWLWDPSIPLRRSLVCWRLIHGRLPTLDVLRRRGFLGPNFCILCASAEESLAHTFWNCPIAAVTWFAFLSWFGLQEHFFPDFSSFLVFAMDTHFSPLLSMLWKIGIITLIWYIWFSRNRCIWDDETASSFYILKMTKAALIEIASTSQLGNSYGTWQEYVILRNLGIKSNPFPATRFISVIWWPPLPGWIKVNTDGAASGAPGNIGAGGVFRDSFSAVRGCFHVDGGLGYAFEAELLAVITAIALAARQGWHQIWLETDSTYVAELLDSHSTKVPWRFFTRWQGTLHLLTSIQLRVSHIFREGNVVADIMASNAVPAGWWPHVIPAIRDAVAKDIHAPGFFREA